MADEWVTIEVNLDDLLEPVEPVIETIDSVLGFLITVLNIVQTILNVIKVFLVGLLDPIRTIVELIIEEVRNIIQDLRQLGVYLTGDWTLIKPENKFADLIGGYQAYERRMLGRLLDRSDPNRPDFSSSSVALGVFFYASSEDIHVLVRIIRAIIKFFGRGDLMGRSRPFATPTTPTFTYGTDGAGLASFRQLAKTTASFRQLAKTTASAVPDRVTVTWSMPAGTAKNRLFSPAPKGFLIHASTIEDGLQVISLSPKTDVSAAVQNLPRVQAAAVDPTTNGPLKLYGALSDIGAAEDPTDFSGVEAFDDAQAPGLVLQKDQNTPLIKASTLQSGDQRLLGDTFYSKVGVLTKIGAGTSYSATFKRDELPLHASFKAGSDGFAEVDTETPTTFFFRIRALDKDMSDALDNGGTLTAPKSLYGGSNRLYFFSREAVNKAQSGVLLPDCTSTFGNTEAPYFSNFTPASGAGAANLPTANQGKYIQAIQAAVALAILCRADLTEATPGEFKYNTYAVGRSLGGVEGGARPLMAWLGVNATWFKGRNADVFRRKMRNAMLQVSTYLQQRGAPPDSLAEVIVKQAEVLIGVSRFKWSDYDSSLPKYGILASILLEDPPDGEGGNFQGIGGNPYCRPDPKKVLIERYYDPQVAGDYLTRVPAFDLIDNFSQTEGYWVEGEGSADLSPIVYHNGDSRVAYYIRNVALQHKGGELLAAAAAVLQVASALANRPVGDAQWVAIRLMPQAFVPLEELLNKLDRFLQGVLDGLQGITDKIIAYIEQIQARIYQLQALLEKIRALLRALTFFSLPSVSALVVVENGTDGLAGALVSAGNKPDDSSLSYGGGAALVTGGIPSVLVETLALIFSGGGGSE